MEPPQCPLAGDFLPLNDTNAQRFVAAFAPLISAQLNRFRLPHDLLADAVQESLIRCLRGLPRFEGRSQLSTWVYRIAYREGLRASERTTRDRQRAQALDPALAPAAPTASPDAAATHADEFTRVRQAMATLPDAQRLALGYHYLDGLAVEEIAILMETRANTVKSWLKRGRDRLRLLLSPDPSLPIDA